MTSSSFGRDAVRIWAPGGTLSTLATAISPASASSASGSLSCESLSCRSPCLGYSSHHTTQACPCQHGAVLSPCLSGTFAFIQV